jgi:hypothetical protein
VAAEVLLSPQNRRRAATVLIVAVLQGATLR